MSEGGCQEKGVKGIKGETRTGGCMDGSGKGYVSGKFWGMVDVELLTL